MGSVQAVVGCGLVLVGLCIESVSSRIWRAGACADRLDIRTALALALPALGLALIAAPTA